MSGADLIYAYFYFIIYSMIGWVCETTYVSIGKRHFVNRGFFYGPYIPIYGLGSLIALYPLGGNMPSVTPNPFVIFFVGALLCTILEYFTSWLMEKLFHMRWWDYSHKKFNIHGRVCLLNSTLFGIMLLVLVYIVHPMFANTSGQQVPWSFVEPFVQIFTVIFVIDGIFTLISLIKRKHVIEKMQKDMEAFQAQFEQDKAVRLAKWDDMRAKQKEKRLAYLADWDEHKDEFVEWLNQKADLSDRVHAFHDNMEKLRNLQHTHAANAFPERQVEEDFVELKKVADELHKKLK